MSNKKCVLESLCVISLLACGSSGVVGAPDGGVAGDSGEGSADVCSNPHVIDNALIEDFESGAIKWFSYQDGTGMLMGTTVNNGPPESNAGEVPGGQLAAHLRGSGFTDFGAGLGFSGWLMCVDVSAFAGISLWAKGGPGTGTSLASGPRFNLLMPATLPVQFGGTCTVSCNDYHTVQLSLTEQWQKYSFRWNQFSQQGFGPPVSFNNRNLIGFNFSFLGSASGTAFDLWIDEVELFN